MVLSFLNRFKERLWPVNPLSPDDLKRVPLQRLHESMALLEDWESGETKKARRSVLFIAALVIGSWWLELESTAALKALLRLGKESDDINPQRFAWFVLALLTYFFVSAALHWWGDWSKYRELRKLTNKDLEATRVRRKYIDKVDKRTGGNASDNEKKERSQIELITQTWKRHWKRTKGAIWRNWIMTGLHLAVFIGLTSWAGLILYSLLCPTGFADCFNTFSRLV